MMNMEGDDHEVDRIRIGLCNDEPRPQPFTAEAWVA
jgi:hypothetical protein